MARFKTLSDWLHWQEGLHPSAIDLGLERITTVAHRMGLSRPAGTVISIAGTNGKGSSLAMLESILIEAGYRVGCYTSPHLVRYNERIRVNGCDVSDRELCAAFGRIDAARNDTSLTYFEFGTLAALDCFSADYLDVALLEVGLGGRLDAVNIIDADLAVMTPISLDHCDWLGDTREKIGREKAGILRHQGVAVCGDREPPASLLSHAGDLAVDLRRIGHEFDWSREADGWNWRSDGCEWLGLPVPALRGAQQLENAATVLAALEALADRLPVVRSAIDSGLRHACLPGRYQVVPGEVATIIDVAHNPQSARALAQQLTEDRGNGRTWAVFGAMRDKDIAGMVDVLSTEIDGWFFVTLPGPRSARCEDMKELHNIHRMNDMEDLASALSNAQTHAVTGDRIVVFGSFVIAGMALKMLDAV